MIKIIFSPVDLQGKAADASLPHVLLVLDQFPESLGGGERVALKLAELLPRFGYRASILTFGIHPKSPALRYASCPIYLLPLQRVYDLNAVRASFSLRAFLRDQNIAIVQTFFESSDLWAGFVTKSMSKAKLIWSRRDMGILRAAKHRVAYRLMANLPDVVLAVSDQVKRHCIEVDHIPPDRVFTLYNGLNLERWPATAKAVKAPGACVVTTVGNVRRVKGHDVLIRAAARIVEQYPQVKFNVVGEILDLQYFGELQQLIADLRLSDQFHFVGGSSDLANYLFEADIFALPSRSEGFSNAVIEAMAASLPVVATNVGGNSEAVMDGVTGYIVEPDDVAALSTAIKKLVEDPACARAMGAEGRNLVIEKFTADAMVQALAARFDALLSTDNVSPD